MTVRLRLIDRYFLSLSLGALFSVVDIIMSLMVLERIPRLVDARTFNVDRLLRRRPTVRE